ncbi:RNA polymerase subunit sigma-24 [Rufibacter sp. DG15C]|uniref:RNA polymerase sigma factor n=1 Tax=Rufibacter sp. DG15C TaxID=1379909 RepID=UPI00078CEEB6|nr:sigma-70 family RNA polymerase sigma factor [Rufibacter sp. DG15C]AMM50668.1 RNA polymerase subunit sigma-24 [Rufibacter sp. DG15C]
MDLQEFKTKVLPGKQKLYRLALFLLQNKEEAEDILQDVFLKLWSNKHKLHAYASIEAFAMTVTKNLCLDRIKARKHKYMIDVVDLELGSHDANPHQRYELADQVSKVQELLQLLPEQQRLILHLRDVEGYDYPEIEQVTGANVNAIRVALSRARKSVRDGLLKMEDYAI